MKISEGKNLAISRRALIALLVPSSCILLGNAIAQVQDPSGKSAIATQSLELPAAVRDQLSSLPRTENPSAPLRVLKFDFIAGSTVMPSESHYETLESGLLGVNTVLSGKSPILTRRLTLKGLIELAYTSESVVRGETTTMLLAGKIFFPLSIQTTLHSTSTRNTTGLSESLLQPKPGSRFSYVHSWEVQLASSAILSSKKVVTNEFKVSYEAANPIDASTLHSDLRGKYLPTCDGLNREGHFTDQLAYLLDCQMYIRLAASNKLGQTSYKITGALYDQ